LNYSQNPDNSGVIADEKDVGRPMSEDTVRNNAGHIIDEGFKLQRVGDL
jgi:hypothetical protein